MHLLFWLVMICIFLYNKTLIISIALSVSCVGLSSEASHGTPEFVARWSELQKVALETPRLAAGIWSKGNLVKDWIIDLEFDRLIIRGNRREYFNNLGICKACLIQRKYRNYKGKDWQIWWYKIINFLYQIKENIIIQSYKISERL